MKRLILSLVAVTTVLLPLSQNAEAYRCWYSYLMQFRYYRIVYLPAGNNQFQEVVIWAKTGGDAKLIFAERKPHCKIIKCEETRDLPAETTIE